jgi:hypothetical protein
MATIRSVQHAIFKDHVFLPLANFHYNKDNKDMKVVEKDKVIGGMLVDEMKRCREMLGQLEKAASALPKGVINKRKKKYKDRIYVYHCLKYRDGLKVINRHIPDGDLQEIAEKLKSRKKLEKEMLAYKKRMAYLYKLLGNKSVR